MNNNNVSFFYNLLDSACTYYYEETKKKYLECFLMASYEIVEGKTCYKVEKETREKLNLVYEQIKSNDFLNEEIRLALELIVVKALKHSMISLDKLTPSTINYLFALIIKEMYKNDITVLDTTLKSGNRLMTILNNFDYSIEASGIEEDKRFVEIASASSNLQDNPLKIYCQKYDSLCHDKVDLVIGELEDNAFEVFLSRLNNIKDDGHFLYLIDNDFFSSKEMLKSKEELDKLCTFNMLITLPSTIVKEGAKQKSIIIGEKRVRDNYNINIITIDSFQKEALVDSLEKIKYILNEMKEN